MTAWLLIIIVQTAPGPNGSIESRFLFETQGGCYSTIDNGRFAHAFGLVAAFCVPKKNNT